MSNDLHSMSRDHYTYELAYPESMGGAVFYVGQGRGNRIDGHEWEARHDVQSPKCDVIRSIWGSGEQIVKRKIDEHLSRKQSLILEAKLVWKYGFENLTNRDPVVTSRKGMAVYTEEWRKRRGELARESWQRSKQSSQR